MENKQMDVQLEQKIKEMLMDRAPESEIVDKKMQEVYNEIRKMKTERKKKLPFAVRFRAIAAILAIVMVYVVKNPAVAAQLPLIGSIFRSLEGDSPYPGDYSKKSIKLNDTSNEKDDLDQDKPDGKSESTQSNQDRKSESAQSKTVDGKTDNTQPGQSDDKKSVSDSYRKKANGVTVTLSEVAYDHDAIFLAILVQNENGFVKDALYPNGLIYDANIKLIKADGSSKDFRYKSEGLFVKSIDGEYVDAHTFKGIYQFREEGVDLSKYVACDLKFGKFQQQLKTGKEETITVPDYGEVTRTIPDSVCYNGPWKFRLTLDGITIHKQETAVHDVNAKGFGIDKVVKTEFEIYAVPILPEGTNVYDYVATIWDADGKPLENRNFGKYLTMSHYGKDISKVTVYLLKTEDFLDNKGNNAHLQPEKAIYKTTVRLED